MRNVIIFADNGAYFGYDKDIKVDLKSKKFIKSLFSNNGTIVYIPLLETFRNIFNEVYVDNEELLEIINNIEDPYNIHLIFNNKTENVNEWDINRFLSKVFNHDIYSDNLCAFVSAEELNGNITNVPIEVFNDFRDKIFEIVEIIVTRNSSEYFKDILVAIGDDTVISVGDDIVEFQNEYIGMKNSLKFKNVIQLNDDENIVTKNGAMLYIHDDVCEYYFCPIQRTNLMDDELKEIIN